MSKTKIKSTHARRVWDSRGRPTVEVEITLRYGAQGRAIAPAGASVGTGEAVELRDGGDALPILAVNPGIAPADAGRWRYLGYKGGSEPGVIAMSFLAQRQDGDWYAFSASWNNSTARVDEARFVALVTRALNLLAQDAPAR